jgi:tRNA(Ile)-lysidine synthase
MRGNIAHLAEAQRFVNYAIDIIRQTAVEQRDGIHYLRLERLGDNIPQGFVAYEILSSVYGFKSDVVNALMRAYHSGVSGKRFYSKEWVAYLERGEIAITPIADDDDCEVVVNEDDMRSFCGNSVLYYEHTDIDQIQTFGVPENMAQIDADALHYPLRLRRWKPGDWFVPFGMSGRKKVGDFLTDTKVSAPERKRQFVLLSGDDIVWVVGRRIDDRFALTSKSENVLKITREII